MLLSHPLRLPLHDEVHQRPGLAVPTPARLSTFSITDTDASSHRAHFNKLLSLWQKPQIGNDVVHADIEFNGTILRWSLHNEFARFTLMQTAVADADFEVTALQALPVEWCKSSPGKIIFAMHALVLPEEQMQESLAESARLWFESRPLVGARIAHEQAIAVSDFLRHPDALVEHGAARLVIFNFAAGKRLIGRMLQDFFEMETYRMMALLSFPLAKKLLPVVTDLEDTLQSITNAIAGGEDPELTQQHLNAVAAKLEEAIAGSHFRFSASRAYSNIMDRRLRDLHERSFESIPSFTEFMERRISPALATVESVRTRLQELSMNLQRTSSLLRTRIEMNLLKQNQGLLAALNRRADAQLRLQETVEGLSVAVLSYYSVSLLHYMLEGAEHLGVPVRADVGTAVAVPVVLIGLLVIMRRVRKRLFGEVVD